MKQLFLLPLLSLFLFAFCPKHAAIAAARTMENIPGLPTASLRTELPAEVWQKLAREPIKAYLVVRAQVVGATVAGGTVVRSEGNGVYDKVAVQMANGMRLHHFGTGSRLPPSVIVHVLIYQLPKGEHAFALAQNDATGDANLIYSRSLRMRFLGLKNAPDPGAKSKKR